MILIIIVVLLLIVLGVLISQYIKSKQELELNEMLFKEISIDKKSHEERKAEIDVLRKLQQQAICEKSDDFTGLGFWDGSSCKKADCKLVFKEELKDIYEMDEIPQFDKENPTWTIGIWLKTDKLFTGGWRNIYKFHEDNPKSLKDRRPGVWFKPKENALYMTYATKSGQIASDIHNEVNAGEWGHLVWVQNGDKRQIYYDGKLVFMGKSEVPEIVPSRLFIGPRTSHLVKNMTICTTPLSMESVENLYRITSKL